MGQRHRHRPVGRRRTRPAGGPCVIGAKDGNLRTRPGRPDQNRPPPVPVRAPTSSCGTARRGFAVGTFEDTPSRCSSSPSARMARSWPPPAWTTPSFFGTSPGGPRLATLKAHTDEVQTVAFGADGRTLASGSRDRTVILWDVAPTPVPGSASCAQAEARGERGLRAWTAGPWRSRSTPARAALWNVERRTQLATLDTAAYSVAFSPNSQTPRRSPQPSRDRVGRRAPYPARKPERRRRLRGLQPGRPLPGGGRPATRR